MKCTGKVLRKVIPKLRPSCAAYGKKRPKPPTSYWEDVDGNQILDINGNPIPIVG